jgi:hypothetical protein
MDTVMTGAVVEMTTKFEARKGRNGWGQFTRRQIKWLGNPATLLASTVGHEFTVEVINTIRQPVTNDDVAYALRHLGRARQCGISRAGRAPGNGSTAP